MKPQSTSECFDLSNLLNVEVLLPEQSEDQFDSKEKRRVETLNFPMFLAVFILIELIHKKIIIIFCFITLVNLLQTNFFFVRNFYGRDQIFYLEIT